ncbi:MAG: hypothetical protein KAW41_02840 [Candidatus Diapherotrites archaeon]|nr:hypothetical protein [Candidatus Diapherotrites archaeon]
MALKFNYKSIKRPDGTTVKTPSIPISLIGKEQFDTVALLDSGADISAIPRDVAEIIGLDLRAKRSPAFGIGGKVDAVDTRMKILVEKGHEKYRLSVPVKVIMGDYDFPILLGRLGFFDKFVITFDQSQQKVSLKKISPKR